MKNKKFFKSDRPKAPFRSSAASKTRSNEGSKAKSPFRSSEKPSSGEKASASGKTRFGAGKAKSPYRSSEKPSFGEKASAGGKTRFGARKGKPSFRSSEKPSFGEDSRDGAKTRYGAGKGKAPYRSSEKPSFGESAHAGARKRYGTDKATPRSRPRDETERDETPRFEKPRFGSKPRYESAKPSFHGKAKPSFRKSKPEPKGDVYTPAEGSVLIWGLHAARAAFLNPKRRITRLWLTESGQKLFEAAQTEARDALLKRPDPKKIERDELDRITPANSVHQGIVIETVPLHEVSLHDVIAADPPPDLILVLDQVTDPHNVGAILRSAAAFGAGALVMTERNAPTTTGVLAKSASGALEHTPMVHVVNLARALDDLREAGYWCVGLAEEGEKTLGALDMSGRTVLVLGAEGDGLRHLTRQKCDELARLPTQGPIGSLNVSNAAAVALYEVRRQAK